MSRTSSTLIGTTAAAGVGGGGARAASHSIPIPIINHAPGILDRRKSLRPGARALRASTRNISSLSALISMAESAAEVHTKDADDDEQKSVKSVKSDTFEDATSTPRPSTSDPDHKNSVLGEVANGIDNAMDKGMDKGDTHDASKSTGDTKSLDVSAEGVSKDDGLEQTAATDSSTATAPVQQDSSEHATEDKTLATPPPMPPRQPSLQTQSVQPKLEAPISLDGSVSPSKSPTPQHSPTRTMKGLSGDFTVVTQPPPSTADRKAALEQRNGNTSPPQQPPNLARKASSGFGALLGRMGTMRKARSPPAPRNDRFSERRGTSSSLASMESGQPAIHDGKPSLQDQFSSLRRQEEFGTNEEEEDIDQRSERTLSDAQLPQSPTRSERASSSGGLKSPSLNPSLPPGTATGMTAGPAAEPREVNWDLWQQLVYEGPAAVARTSGEELNQAITSGIPPAIRGVVWQILAESKNEELENVYRLLKARGAETEQRPTPSRPGSNISVNAALSEKDAVTSDASSEHSDRSAATNSGIASPPTSVESLGPEARSKLLEEKLKREAAALQKLEKAIKRDMGTRTSYSAYTKSAGLQDGLFGVCKAYALFDEGVGYAQGINFIAMPLLFNMSEEEAFTLLVRLMSKYDLRSLFTADMTGLHLRLYQFERLLETYEPAVYCHLRRKHVAPQLYATQWFLTLFAYRFPLQLVLRIYDLILSEGLTAILKFGIVLMQRNREALLNIKDMSHLANFLKEKIFDVYIDKSPSASSLLDSGFFGSVTGGGGADKELYRADEMVRDACQIKISDETLAQYTVEWEEQQRTERERETELETLRISNQSLTAKVRALEERVVQHDTEHVQMAQDLVRIKVENDALLDQNEGLKLQVTELQKMVDAQPAEVEEKLREEMDRIMKRNLEVQNENRHIKEGMDEMEHELVNVKMSHAQTQADYETIKQKWSSVQALLSEK